MRVKQPLQIKVLGSTIVKALLQRLGTGLLLHQQPSAQRMAAAVVEFIALGENGTLTLYVKDGYVQAPASTEPIFVTVQFFQKNAHYAVMMEGLCHILPSAENEMKKDCTPNRLLLDKPALIFLEIKLDNIYYYELRPHHLAMSDYVLLQSSANIHLYRFVTGLSRKKESVLTAITAKIKRINPAPLRRLRPDQS